MEEEECNGCDGANPQRRLEDSLLRLADVRLIVATTVGAAARRRWSPATATMSMPAIDIGALFIGREDWVGNNGSGVAMEDDDNTDVEAGEYARIFLEVVLRQLWKGHFRRKRTTMKTTETRSDDEHEEDVMMRSISKTLARGSHHRRRPWLACCTDRWRGGRGGSVADEKITDGARTLATMERGICCDGNDYTGLLYIQQ